ncbi:hypothetical protein ACFFX0_18290 [Citricoccus parietis]|uniref:Uncharacterized protein n=1 Tax=Citricoccus parietis TaxID=592307 RepID=A0ABV5G293_9MICC
MTSRPSASCARWEPRRYWRRSRPKRITWCSGWASMNACSWWWTRRTPRSTTPRSRG